MTIIAYRAGVMASDSLTVSCGTRTGTTKKVARGPGVIGGACGTAIAVGIFLQWVQDGARGPLECMHGHDGFSGLLVRDDGRIWCYEQDGSFERLGATFCAIGMGRDVALGAMAFGATAAKAAEIATQFDITCGGDIQVVSLADAA